MWGIAPWRALFFAELARSSAPHKRLSQKTLGERFSSWQEAVSKDIRRLRQRNKTMNERPFFDFA
jgi:hypothetical protein